MRPLFFFVFVFVVSAATLFSVSLSNESEFVVTPNGLIPAECAYQVPDGTHIVELEDGANLLFPDGSSRTIGFCKAKLPQVASAANPPQGWQVYTFWVGPNNLTSFNGSWNVPDIPSDKGGQTLFLFNGLQNNCGGYGVCPKGVIRTKEGLISEQTNIIQPVLQFGGSAAGGGAYWGIASWYVATVGTVYTSVYKVSPNDILLGNMSKIEGSKNKWVISLTDQTDPKVNPAVLTVSKGSLTDYEPDAYVTLEVYSVTNCDQYPKTAVQFTQLAIAEDYTTPVNIPWQINTYSHACNEQVQIMSSSEVNIDW